jgi:hypothetical protein
MRSVCPSSHVKSKFHFLASKATSPLKIQNAQISKCTYKKKAAHQMSHRARRAVRTKPASSKSMEKKRMSRYQAHPLVSKSNMTNRLWPGIQAMTVGTVLSLSRAYFIESWLKSCPERAPKFLPKKYSTLMMKRKDCSNLKWPNII